MVSPKKQCAALVFINNPTLLMKISAAYYFFGTRLGMYVCTVANFSSSVEKIKTHQ